MTRNSLRNLIVGFAMVSLGLALAVAIPNTFTSGAVISSSAMNANFVAMEAAINTLEAKSAALEAKVAALETAKNLRSKGAYYAYAYVAVSGFIETIYSFNPTGGIVGDKTDVGNYVITFSGTHPAIRSVQVSVVGTEAVGCRVTLILDNAVAINCYDTSGIAKDSYFTVSVVN
jgi:hypothetical protein